MSDASTNSGQQASYELNYELDGTSFSVRENLVDILERELLGPIHGPGEVLPFSPRSVGAISTIPRVGSTLIGAQSPSVALGRITISDAW